MNLSKKINELIEETFKNLVVYAVENKDGYFLYKEELYSFFPMKNENQLRLYYHFDDDKYVYITLWTDEELSNCNYEEFKNSLIDSLEHFIKYYLHNYKNYKTH